jgi:Arc/MetJ-type ribon-helix-helix transcriptional regulator
METDMVRTQIQLTEEQLKKLRKIAVQRNISMSELIRQGIDFYLQTCGNISLEERRQRAIKAAGQFHSGKTDLSEKHDAYLAEAYK